MSAPKLENPQPRFSSPQEEALLNLTRTSDALNRALQQRLKPFHLTPTQYNVLRILRGARPTGLTWSAIGSRMIAAEPDITRLLARLKTQKMLYQQRDGRDKRVLWTHISSQGLEILAKLDGLIEKAPRELLGQLTCDEVTELNRLLTKLQGRCSEEATSHAAGESPSGKLSSPHSRRSSPLHHRPE
jgi:DNA-binding MarR family transcriptional regulator